MQGCSINHKDQGFCLNGKCLLAKHFQQVDVSSLVLGSPLDIYVRECEMEAVESNAHYLIGSKKQDDWMMTVGKLASYRSEYRNFLLECSKHLAVPAEMTLISSADQLWNNQDPHKKQSYRNYLRTESLQVNHQILFVECSESTDSKSIDFLFRSSAGEILSSIRNTSEQGADKLVLRKLMTLPRSDTFVMFYSQHRYRTLDLEYLRELAEKGIEFIYVHANFRPDDTCLPPTKNNLFNVTFNPFIYLFQQSSWIIFGSSKTLSLKATNMIPQLINHYRQMINKEKSITDTFFPDLLPSPRLQELKNSLWNMYHQRVIRNEPANLQQICNKLILSVMKELKVNMDKKTIRLEKRLVVGHFPQKIKHCKECRVCVRKFNESMLRRKTKKTDDTKIRKKKSKYQCEACSVEEGRPVPLCVTCFAEYHRSFDWYKHQRPQNTLMELKKIQVPQNIKMQDVGPIVPSQPAATLEHIAGLLEMLLQRDQQREIRNQQIHQMYELQRNLMMNQTTSSQQGSQK